MVGIIHFGASLLDPEQGGGPGSSRAGRKGRTGTREDWDGSQRAKDSEFLGKQRPAQTYPMLKLVGGKLVQVQVSKEDQVNIWTFGFETHVDNFSLERDNGVGITNLTRSREALFSLHYKPQGRILGDGSKNLHTQKEKKKRGGGGEGYFKIFRGASSAANYELKTSKI